MTGAALDHLVVVADTLDAGVAWCEATLGVTPGPGGAHPLMGTHNRLLSLEAPGWPQAYLEIIALDPKASRSAQVPQRRWFDMDDEPLRARVSRNGPQLVHWVARVPALDETVARLRAAGLDPGTPTAASRPTPAGLLQWRITLRDDGRPQLGGALPALIEWIGPHPVQAMPPSGLVLASIALRQPDTPAGCAALDTLGLSPLALAADVPALQATLETPRGRVTLATAA